MMTLAGNDREPVPEDHPHWRGCVIVIIIIIIIIVFSSSLCSHHHCVLIIIMMIIIGASEHASHHQGDVPHEPGQLPHGRPDVHGNHDWNNDDDDL